MANFCNIHSFAEKTVTQCLLYTLIGSKQLSVNGMRDVWERNTGELKSKQLQPAKGNKSREMSYGEGGIANQETGLNLFWSIVRILRREPKCLCLQKFTLATSWKWQGGKFKNSAVMETVKVLSSRGKNTLDCALICSNWLLDSINLSAKIWETEHVLCI